MLVKVDEDLPNAVVHFLRQQGHDAMGVVEQGMGGWKDPVLWQAIQAERRFLVTADKGFADARQHPPGTHCGILLLRPDEDGVRPVIELIQNLLSAHPLESLAGSVTAATPRGIRIRRCML